VCDFGYERVVGVGVGEHRADGEKDWGGELLVGVLCVHRDNDRGCVVYAGIADVDVLDSPFDIVNAGLH